MFDILRIISQYLNIYVGEFSGLVLRNIVDIWIHVTYRFVREARSGQYFQNSQKYSKRKYAKGNKNNLEIATAWSHISLKSWRTFPGLAWKQRKPQIIAGDWCIKKDSREKSKMFNILCKFGMNIRNERLCIYSGSSYAHTRQRNESITRWIKTKWMCRGTT